MALNNSNKTRPLGNSESQPRATFVYSSWLPEHLINLENGWMTPRLTSHHMLLLGRKP